MEPIDTLKAIGDSIAHNTDLLETIRDNTALTVKNTDFDFIWNQVCLISIITLLLSLLAVWPLWTEFKKDRINRKAQRLLFEDIVRHLYRNKVVSIAMRLKYEFAKAKIDPAKNEFCYPSEEHYLKLQFLPQDLHVERFAKASFNDLHYLELLFRNYNTEVNVAQKHVTDPRIDRDTISRDFQTLDFKPGYLISKITHTMANLWNKRLFNLLLKKGDIFEVTRECIQKSHDDNLRDSPNKNFWGNEYAEVLSAQLEEEGYDKDWFYKSVFNKLEEEEINQWRHKFQQWLYEDVLIECGLNSKQSPKIHIAYSKKQD